MQPGAKRPPSSLVQATTSIGRRVSTPASRSACTASSAASTPQMPSKRPPAGWLSMWLPASTGARPGTLPSARRNRLPSASMEGASPIASPQPISSRRESRSNGVRQARFTPSTPSAPRKAPSFAICISRSHCRASLTAATAFGAIVVSVMPWGSLPHCQG